MIKKDNSGNERYMRITPGLIENKPEGWDDALTSREFLSEMKKMMKKKFDDPCLSGDCGSSPQ
ncbi:MAG: hypothetical protein LBQ01_01635 [Prevotellaceae bacterium]|jgi:hypothetical protein|nr:hypothetical protein [Prevotellaceae bacterium]